MRTASIVLKEIWQRKWRFLMALVGIVLPITVFVAASNIMVYSQDEVRKTMLDMGLNFFILPRELDLGDYYTMNFGDATMPEDYVDKLFKALFRAKEGEKPAVIARHFFGMLHGRIEIDGHKAILTGVLPEKDPKAKPKPGDVLKPGEVKLGKVIADALNLGEDDVLTIKGHKLKVTQVLSEEGAGDDVRIKTDLHTAQDILGKGRVINAIEALSCVCYGMTPVQIAREMEKKLPGTRAITRTFIATVRWRTREHIRLVSIVLISLTLIMGGFAVANQAFADVRERRREIGMFLAIGAGPLWVAGLFLEKFVLLGLLGGAIGYLVGNYLARALGPGILKTWQPFQAASGFISWKLALIAMLIAVGMSLVCSAFSALKAARLDPAAILREE